MKRRLPAVVWLLLVAAFAGTTACAGSCAGPRPGQSDPPPPSAGSVLHGLLAILLAMG